MTRLRVPATILPLLLAGDAASAQQRGWGIEASASYLTWPRSIVEDLVEDYADSFSVEGYTFTGRLCRLKENGAPSYFFGYVQTRITASGVNVPESATFNGFLMLRGAVITKYVNFAERSGGSFGLAVGGGIARANARGVETFTPPNRAPYTDVEDWKNKPFPLLEFGLQGDVLLGRRLSAFVFGGFQHVGLGGGAGLRYRFR